MKKQWGMRCNCRVGEHYHTDRCEWFVKSGLCDDCENICLKSLAIKENAELLNQPMKIYSQD